MLTPHVAFVFSTALLVGTSILPAAEDENRRGKQIFYRMVGSQNNARVLPKTRSVWTQDRQEHTGVTGMADEGFTEFPFCFGVMDFTFAEDWAIYPRLVSGAQASETRVNTADILIDHVYEPQASVWGWRGHEFVQTFTATRGELVRIALRLSGPDGDLRAALLENGPGGRQIGPTKTFPMHASPAGGWPGSTEYSTTRWEPGQAPLVPGRPYGIRIWRADGRPLVPYLHATGNAYDGGMLYVDGIPHPESDLALWINEEPGDLRRARIEGADENGWVYRTTRLVFVPQTPNIRLISLKVSPVRTDPPAEHNCTHMVVRVFSKDGTPLVGRKTSLACGPVDGQQTGHFLYATDELKVTPGEPCQLDVHYVPFRSPLPSDSQVVIKPLDLNARIYGEPEPGALPSIHNLAMEFVTDSTLKITWARPAVPSTITVHTWGQGESGNTTFEAPAAADEIVIPKLWAGHHYNIRLVARGPTGLTWSTPLYRIRMPKPSENIAGETQSKDMPHLLALAPSDLVREPQYPPLRYISEIAMTNNSFEQGLEGWTAAPAGALSAPDVGWQSPSRDKSVEVDSRWGNRMAGFTHRAGRDRHEVRQQSLLTRKIPTRPGHVYVLMAGVHTAVLNGADGDTRVRLLADPDGGDDVQELGLYSSQWYWTAGRWMNFQHRWRARAEQSTIGFGFFRRHDLDRSSAYVDNVRVYDLGPAPLPHDAETAALSSLRRLVLVEPKVEAEDKVEAFLQAPPGYVITGLGTRAHEDNITTLWLRVQPLLADGSLGPAEQLLGGYDPGAGLEAVVELPDGYVATGFGAGIAPEWDVKRLGVWARPLNADGTLGEEKLFRGGSDLQSGFEREIRMPHGRVLTSAGLNCMFNDANGIRGESRALIHAASSPGSDRSPSAAR